ncbi:MAG: thymidine phosphorylase [Micavibrio aeruginosavorus]|uniref:thymidine phosphorylase n=1 Tax=Micavibrio aeruginosavorus TaxID=349221 RepID=A0A7T5UHH9_9BACT|nr:MAG: thymidine phosphorylase [Micavibrio aeruginosavorus]
MLTQEIIIRKRSREALSAVEIQQYVKGIVDKSVSESQIAAMCMAILLNGMNKEERVSLTMAMANSGTRIDWRQENLDGPVLDKHSTGGVGDKVSLMLAPIIAACGGYVPMISGRGLGHTGGTLDKMDSIPGYISQPDLQKLKDVVRDVGCAIVGATSDIAPADRTIYAVRDVTGTVESMDLITASILSKKLAAGLDGLVLDVKYGSGAWFTDYARTRDMAQTLVDVANGAGLRCHALLTDMNEVLGRTAGNAIEAREAIEFLRCENIDARLREVTLGLCGELLMIGSIAESAAAGYAMAERHLHDGRAASFFERMVHALGGPANIIDDFPRHLPLAPLTREIRAARAGVIKAVDTRKIGIAVIELGGGRRLASDKIDHGAGLSGVAAIGQTVGTTDPLCLMIGRDEDSMRRAESLIREAYIIGDPGEAVIPSPLIRESIIP